MNFAHPWWLLAGILACAALLWVWRRHDARQRRALEQFVSPQLRTQLTQSISGARILVKRTFFAASIALLFIALAGPQAGFRWEQVKRRGNDILFAVDTSRSMMTPDVKPNRLARAKLAIDDFVHRLNGDAVGLVAFAGTAFLQTPITLDYGAFHESLAALDTHIIPRGGTNIAAAIHEAQAALQRRPGSDKILILVTDGEDLEGNALAAAKAAASQDGLKIFTVGVGSANGDLIPLPADQGGGFLKDGSGQLVKSRLDEPALKAIAAATGGSYAPLGADNQGLDTIYQQALAPLAKHDLESRAQRVYTQRFQWPLGASLVLLLASTMVGTRRRLAAERSPATGDENAQSLSRLAMPTSAAVLSLCWLLPVHSAHASPSSAAAAYKRGDFSSAERDYAAAAANDAKQPILQFDAGAAAYKSGEFPMAARAFQASVNASTSGGARRLVDQEDAYYNLGNTLYREGQKTEQADPKTTMENWTQALKAYDAALQLRTDDTDSKFNRDLVSRKLEALKKAQSQQKQTAQNQPKQPPQPQPSQPQQAQRQGQQQGQQQGQKPGQGQQAKDNSSPPKSQPPAEQSKQQPGGQPPEGKGEPQQAKQNSGGASSSKGQTNPDRSPAASEGSMPPPNGANGKAGSQPGTVAQAGDDQRLPGEMSRQEARELLDSVKDEEHRPPTAPLARNGASDTTSDEPLKDW
jgi:Ca-activated chloride channel family protein